MTAPPDELAAPATHDFDRRRVLSFVGLVLGRLGPRAHGTVSGVFLTLLVHAHTRSLFLTTFALTAHRLFTWASYPVIGRLSDRADTRVGRRTPYMGAGLLVLAVCTALYPVVGSFWVLVVLMVIGRQALVVYRLPSIAQTPEIFGGSRWVRALLNVAVLGAIVGISIRVTVIATWKRDDPSTWRPAYWIAASFIALAGVAVLTLVREAPAALEVTLRTPVGTWRQRIGEVLALPNARVLAAAGLLAVAAGGFTERAYPVYVQETLGAGGRELAMIGLVGGPLGFLTSFPAGFVLARRLDRRTIAVLASLGGAAYSFAHLFITNVWQSFWAGIVVGPLGVAAGVALFPLALQLVPRSGGIAERLGLFAGPIALVGVATSYAAGLAYDHLVHDYRVIWALAGVCGLLVAVPLMRLRVPPGEEHTDVVAAFRIARSVLGAGSSGSRGLFRGDVTARDADSVAILEELQRRLDPYAQDTDAKSV